MESNKTEQTDGSAAKDITDLARRLGHAFAQPELLCEALTHPSAAVRHPDGTSENSYQRLEFLGDRVLGLVIADLLLQRFPKEAEGPLALRHVDLVRRETLADVGRRLDLGQYLRLARGEAVAGERENPALLADACEAVIGALYLDGGLPVVRAIIEEHWEPMLVAAEHPPQDAKTALQEWAQARALALPDYQEVNRTGPAHEPIFTVEVYLEGQPAERGEGRSKRLAEQAAAERLMSRLGEHNV
ncbi:MAG: ribonuclease III [Alphaproteobacteria bacterium]